MLNIAILAAAYFFMEFVAWFSHKYVMHGFAWAFHRDHHIKTALSGSFFEKNDIFFIIYALPAIILIIAGLVSGLTPLVAAGAGITLYGLTYFLLHDVMIHHRLPFRINTSKGYLAALVRAHEAHHKGKNVRDFSNYGLLVFPSRFFRNQ